MRIATACAGVDVVVATELVPDVAMTKRRTMTTAAAAEVFRLE
jgi:hypothetical protein